MVALAGPDVIKPHHGDRMSTSGGRARCPDCGAQLRRGREVGQRCDPCQRSGRRIVLVEGFYDQPGLEAALAGFEFGPVFRAVRAVQHWSQQTLGEFLMSLSLVSRWHGSSLRILLSWCPRPAPEQQDRWPDQIVCGGNSLRSGRRSGLGW